MILYGAIHYLQRDPLSYEAGISYLAATILLTDMQRYNGEAPDPAFNAFFDRVYKSAKGAMWTGVFLSSVYYANKLLEGAEMDATYISRRIVLSGIYTFTEGANIKGITELLKLACSYCRRR